MAPLQKQQMFTPCLKQNKEISLLLFTGKNHDIGFIKFPLI
jgi:hypothetical protein